MGLPDADIEIRKLGDLAFIRQFQRTVKGDFGAYRFEIDVVSDTTNLLFKHLIKNELSLKHQNAGYSGIMISDKLIVN